MTATPSGTGMGSDETPATDAATRLIRRRWSAVAAVVALVLIGSIAGYSAGRGQSGGRAGALTSAGANASIIGGSAVIVDNIHVSYVGLVPGPSSSNEASAQAVMPTSGTISNLCVTIRSSGVNFADATWTFTVRKNGTASEVTTSIGMELFTCDEGHRVEFVTGDVLSISATPTDSPATFPSVTWTAALVPSP